LDSRDYIKFSQPPPLRLQHSQTSYLSLFTILE
jgi:hypothetical protein